MVARASGYKVRATITASPKLSNARQCIFQGWYSVVLHSYATLCYIMLHYATLCYIMLHHAHCCMLSKRFLTTNHLRPARSRRLPLASLGAPGLIQTSRGKYCRLRDHEREARANTLLPEGARIRNTNAWTRSPVCHNMVLQYSFRSAAGCCRATSIESLLEPPRGAG